MFEIPYTYSVKRAAMSLMTLLVYYNFSAGEMAWKSTCTIVDIKLTFNLNPLFIDSNSVA